MVGMAGAKVSNVRAVVGSDVAEAYDEALLPRSASISSFCIAIEGVDPWFE
jgi:hypothetical protein